MSAGGAAAARRTLVAATLGSLVGGAAIAAASLAAARIVPPPAMPRPGYLEPAVDTAFGTSFVRVTDPGGRMAAGVTCARAYCTHRYSSAQAWNADQTLLVIANGCGGLCFLDGQTYAPLFHRARSDECEWHPTDAERMICVSGRTVSLWRPRDNTAVEVYTDARYRTLQFGPYKGNPTWDGRRIVLRAADENGALFAFAYDIAARRKFPAIALADLPGKNSMCSISPLGTYVLCTQETAGGIDQAFVFTVEGERIQSWTEHHRPGHGDMTVDADGAEVYVGISKAWPDKYHVIKRRLRDGAVTDLAPFGLAQHASTRALRRPGWVFVSYAGEPSLVARSLVEAPFVQEVVALRIDGSGEIKRVTHTWNAPHDYWSETHASPSPDGSQVIWSSNWGRPGGPVADFVTRLTWDDAPRPPPGSAHANNGNTP